MKKSFIITVGIVLLLLVLGAWMYLLFFGTPETSDDVFANLGFGNTSDTSIPTPTEPTMGETAPFIDTKDALRQLTTRPVAGFGFVGTSSNIVRYAERGTGHVYEIEIDTGTEKRISGTTIPQVVEAVFSKSGNSVAFVSESDTERRVYVGEIQLEASSIDFLTLPPNAFEPHFENDTTVHYALPTNIGTDGYSIDIRNTNSVRIFSIPLREIHVIWGDYTYVYNKPSQYSPGALYRIGSSLTPITPQSFAYVGGVSGTHYFGSESVNGKIKSYALNQNTEAKTSLTLTYIPEKCAVVERSPDTMWCTSPVGEMGAPFLEDWYKGVTYSEDSLWTIDLTTGESLLHIMFLAESGRIIDVDTILASYDGYRPLFRNKLDGTLWLYDSTLK